MPRRPLTIAAATFGCGIAYQHLAADALSAVILTGVCILVFGMLFYLPCEWNNLQLLSANGNLKEKETDEKQTEISDETAECQERRRAVWKRFCSIVLVFFLLGAVRGCASEHRETALEPFLGTEVTLAGRVASVEIKEDSCSFVLRGEHVVWEASKETAERLPGEKALESGKEAFQTEISGERVLVRVSEMDGKTAAALTGKRVLLRGTPELADSASNPGSFDYRLYLHSRKIGAVMRMEAEQLQVSEDVPGVLWRLGNRIAVLRYAYEQRMASVLGDSEAQLFAGILFGDDAAMDESMKESFQKNGLAHLLAASGLHVGFVYGLLQLLMRKPKSLTGNLPIIGALLVYVALAGFSASVVRAVFMIVVHMVARIRHRRYDFLTCIAFCALVMLVWEPMQLFSSGFQLSFLAVLTLSVVLRRMELLLHGVYKAVGDRKAALLRPVAGTLSGVVAIQLGMMPLTLVHFHYLSIAGLFLNVPAIALAGLIVPIGILLMPAVVIGGPLFLFLAGMEEMLLRLLLEMNELLYETPLSFHYAATPPMGVLLFYYIVLFFCCSESGAAWSGKRLPRRLTAVVLGGVLACSSAFGFVMQKDYLLADMIFVDVGQGDCTHLKTGGHHVLIDTGGKESFFSQSDTADAADDAAGSPPLLGKADPEDTVGTDILIPYLLGNGVSELDAVVLSHLHQDHCGALAALTKAVSVKCLILPAAYRSKSEQISRESGIPEDRLVFAAAGDRITVGKLQLSVLTPERKTAEEYCSMLETADENELSMLLRAEYRDWTALFTGDIDEEYETELVRRFSVKKTTDAGKNERRDSAGLTAATAENTELLRSDILKAAHHGSKYSSCTAFLEAVRPSVTVISVGTNVYGHPTEEAMSRIRSSGSRLYRTDEDGAVLLRLRRSLQVWTMKESS